MVTIINQHWRVIREWKVANIMSVKSNTCRVTLESVNPKPSEILCQKHFIDVIVGISKYDLQDSLNEDMTFAGWVSDNGVLHLVEPIEGDFIQPDSIYEVGTFNIEQPTNEAPC